MIRLRQVALVAADLDSTVAALCEHLGLTVCYHDPGVGMFGLHNALMTDRRPVPGGRLPHPGRHHRRAAVGQARWRRWLHQRAIYEVDDLDARETALDDAGVRIVWRGDLPDIHGRHLHPADIAARSSASTSRCPTVRGDGRDRPGKRTRTWASSLRSQA